MGAWQRRRGTERLERIARPLRDLGALTGGRFHVGPVLGSNPFSGEIRAPGITTLQRGGLVVEVTVAHPSGDLTDDRTEIRVPLPAGRRWALQKLRLRRKPASLGDALLPGAFEKLFATGGGTVPDRAREPLARLAAGAHEVRFESGTFVFYSADALAAPGVNHVTDPERLRQLADDTAAAAETLLCAP